MKIIAKSLGNLWHIYDENLAYNLQDFQYGFLLNNFVVIAEDYSINTQIFYSRYTNTYRLLTKENESDELVATRIRDSHYGPVWKLEEKFNKFIGFQFILKFNSEYYFPNNYHAQSLFLIFNSYIYPLNEKGQSCLLNNRFYDRRRVQTIPNQVFNIDLFNSKAFNIFNINNSKLNKYQLIRSFAEKIKIENQEDPIFVAMEDSQLEIFKNLDFSRIIKVKDIPKIKGNDSLIIPLFNEHFDNDYIRTSKIGTNRKKKYVFMEGLWANNPYIRRIETDIIEDEVIIEEDLMEISKLSPNKLFHEISKLIHPDLEQNSKKKKLRTELFQKLNNIKDSYEKLIKFHLEIFKMKKEKQI